MSTMAWFTLPLNRAQVVLSKVAALLGLSTEPTLLARLFSMLLDRLRLKKLPACSRSRFHVDDSSVVLVGGWKKEGVLAFVGDGKIQMTHWGSGWIVDIVQTIVVGIKTDRETTGGTLGGVHSSGMGVLYRNGELVFLIQQLLLLKNKWSPILPLTSSHFKSPAKMEFFDNHQNCFSLHNCYGPFHRGSNEEDLWSVCKAVA